MWSCVPWDSDLRMTAPSRASSNCKRQTRPLIREGASHQQIRNCLAVIKIWSWAPDGCLTPRQTGRLTVGRNITLTLTVTLTRVAVENVSRNRGLGARQSPAGNDVSGRGHCWDPLPGNQ
jgi:hypothetical protein